MAQSSGFFNALEVSGVYDRLYNADSYSDNMGAIISTGVRRSGDNDLRVTASGLTITVGVGRAWIEGRWYYNDTALTLTTVSPPVGTLSRMDGVFLQLNTNVNVRTITLVYKTGTAAQRPTAPACTRDGGVYEVMLASVLVAPDATSVTITDTRADTTVCGWVTSPVGYDDYFANLDAEFNEWFGETKDTVASVTLFKQYIWTTTLTASATSVRFNIPQYDSSGVDIINVYTNGLLEIAGTDYTLSGSTITFTAAKTSGTEIAVICYKSIDGTGLGSVSDEITALQNQVAELGDINDYYYFCNGSTDNVEISTLVQTFLNGSASDNKKMKLHICGTFGATAAAAGSGTSAVPYRWFDFSSTTTTNRQVTLDFYNCSPAAIAIAAGSWNAIFYGGNFNVEGMTITAAQANSESCAIYGVQGAAINTPISFTDCNISITQTYGGSTTYFAQFGTFTNCKIVMIDNSPLSGTSVAVFYAADTSSITIFGGKYYAYTGASTGYSAGIYSPSSAANAAVTVFGAAFPSTSKASLYQTNAVRFNAGYITAVGLVTPLLVATTSAVTASITGTIPLDKD